MPPLYRPKRNALTDQFAKGSRSGESRNREPFSAAAPTHSRRTKDQAGLCNACAAFSDGRSAGTASTQNEENQCRFCPQSVGRKERNSYLRRSCRTGSTDGSDIRLVRSDSRQIRAPGATRKRRPFPSAGASPPGRPSSPRLQPFGRQAGKPRFIPRILRVLRQKAVRPRTKPSVVLGARFPKPRDSSRSVKP